MSKNFLIFGPKFARYVLCSEPNWPNVAHLRNQIGWKASKLYLKNVYTWPIYANSEKIDPKKLNFTK